MKNELQLIVEDRLKTVLIKDKEQSPYHVLNVLKSEIYYILKNYMEILNDEIDVSFNLNSAGNYTLSIFADVKRLKRVSAIIPD